MFDFLGLKHQSIQFLTQMGGHEMGSEAFYKWILVKSEIETEILKEEADKRENTKLNRTNQKIKYDQLSEELEKSVVKIMELWKLVTEENTKVRNIRDHLHKVTENLIHLKAFWEREQRYLDNIPKCQILYGMFLKDSINETEEGEAMIKRAFEELDKRKASVLNFSEIDASSSLLDLEKAVAFVKVTRRSNGSFIENCTVTFAKYLGTVKKNLVGTLLAEYIPQEFLQSFIDSALGMHVPKDSNSKDSTVEASIKFPMLTYHGRLLKEFFVQTKVFLDQNGDKILALNLTIDQEFATLKFIMTLNGQLRYVNSSNLLLTSDDEQVL